MKMEKCSETSALKIRKPGNHPKKEYNNNVSVNCLNQKMWKMMRYFPVGSIINLLTPNDYSGRTAPLTSKVAFYIFIQQIWILNILNMAYTLLFFFSSKCSLFHNSNVFGSCIIHISYTGCAKIKKNNSGTKRLKHCNNLHYIAMKCLCFVVPPDGEAQTHCARTITTGGV